MSIFLISSDIFQNPKREMDGHHLIDPFTSVYRVHLPVGRARG
jgi:hypothetical protein